MDYARIIDYNLLMSYASSPTDGLTQAFAGMILSSARSGFLPPDLPIGLTRDHFAELLDDYFPGARETLFEEYSDLPGVAPPPPFRADEVDDLLALLLEHRSIYERETVWLACAIAAGCMGQDHLYQDMGLPNRQALSELLKRNFTALFEKNVANMKWKKFFYKQLCDRAEVNMCKAPSCQVCDDYSACFAPEV
jgi:nitrogen fixation protein NifQ